MAPMTKRLIRGTIKTVAAIAAVVFLLAPIRTSTGLLLFVGSIVVLLVCFGLLKVLEEDDEYRLLAEQSENVKASMSAMAC